MTPIKSNTKGRGIHSPFAFRMVTEFLFPKKENNDIESLIETYYPETEKTFLKLVCRMLALLPFENVVVTGNESEKTAVILKSLISQNILCNNLLTFNNELAVWLSPPEIFPILPEETGNSVWLLKKICDNEMRNFFDEIRENKKVTQTFELKTHGVVIFNPTLQKEDYIIKGRKSW